MSDLFDNFDGFASLTSGQVPPAPKQETDWRADIDAFIQEAGRRGKDYIVQRETYVNKYKVNLSDGQFDHLRRGVENGTFDEGEIYKQAASMYIAGRHALPSDFVREHLDKFSLAFNIDQEQYSPAGFWDVVKSCYLMSDNYTTANELKWELLNADDPQWRAALIQEIKRLEEENVRIFDTGEVDTKTLRGKALWALCTIADALPYMRNMAVRQAAGTAIGVFTGAPFLGQFLGWEYGKNVEGGALYWELLEAGVADEVAKKWATIGGALSSGAEQLLMGSIAKAGKGIKGLATGKAATGKAANWIVSHAFTKLAPGGAAHRTMTLFADYLLNIPQEAGEEGVQSLTTGAAGRRAVDEHNLKLQEAIDSLPEEQREALTTVLKTIPEGEDRAVHAFTGMAAAVAADVIREADLRGDISDLPEDVREAVLALREVQKRPWKEIWAQAREEAAGGAVAAIGTGIPGVTFNAGASVREARRLRREAAAGTNFESFAREARQSKNFEGEPPAKVEESVKKLWEGGQQERAQTEAKRAEELKNKRLYGAMDKSGDVYRGEGGGLYMEIDRHEESGGLETFEFAAGNKYGGEQNSYAIGRAEMRGDVPVITELRIGEKYEGLRDEILQNVANDIGKEFEYEGQRYAPNGEGRSLRFGWNAEKAAPRMGRGFDFNKPYYGEPDTRADTAAKRNFAGQLRNLDTRLSSDAEINTVVDFYDRLGRKLGKGFDAFTQALTGGKTEGFFRGLEVTDEVAARWIAKNEGAAADPEAVRRILENLTDAQRQEARENIYGYTLPGADGAVKAIYAARDADVSTFIHEGVHAFTLIAKKLDPSLFRQMMEAAGFSTEEYGRADAAGKEGMTRDAMETLAYGAEAYLKEGPKGVRNAELHSLYERIKEFLKDLRWALDKAKYLTPETRALFDGLFGEQAGDAEAAARTTEDGAAQAATGKDTAMGTDGRQEAAGERQEANAEASAGAESFEEWKKRLGLQELEGITAKAEELEIYSDSFDEKIKDKSLPIRIRVEAVMRKAGREYTDALLDERDRGHRPTAELIKRAGRITDAAERRRVIAEIRELRKRYAGTAAEFKAPNGKASLLIDALGEELGRQAWYAVRTENFKEWFGDWERAARIALFENSPNISLDGNAYEGKYELNKESILDYLENTLRKETMRNPAIDADIRLAGKGIKKLTHWGMKNETYKKLFAHIPELTQKAIVLLEEKPNKTDTHYNKYTHLACGIAIDGKPHTVHIILGENQGQWYYSHILLDIEKGSLLAGIRQSTPGHPIQASPIKKGASQPYIQQSKPGHPESASLSDIKDTTLLRLLQADSSKIVDENGEPLPVFHGGTFKKSDIPREGMHFGSEKAAARRIKDKRARGETEITAAFLNIKNPVEMPDTYIKDWGKSIEWAKAKGHDGIIYKNNVEAKGSRSYIAFEPNQIKSATDNAGTFDPDNPSILFSEAFRDKEYTAVEKKIIQDTYGTMSEREIIEKAKTVLGITTNFDEAGYILPDGAMLSISSGKSFNFNPGGRYLEHREPGGFLLIGNIRIDTDSGGIELTRMPTVEQAVTLRKYIKHHHGNIAVDFTKADSAFLGYDGGDDPFTRLAALYTSTKADKILNDIANYYKKEAEGNIYFQAAFHGSPYRFERFDSSHMGEGEGAQAYGWGHYFASRKEIAEWYYEELSNSTLELSDLGDIAAERVMSLAKDSGLLGYIYDYEKEKYKIAATEETNPDIARILSIIPQKEITEEERRNKLIQDYEIFDVIKYIEETGETTDIDGLYKTISSFVGSDEKANELFKKNDLEYKPGQLYEADIPGDEEMLDWDKLYEEQPPLIQKALKPVMERRSELHKKILKSQIAKGNIAPRDVDADEWVTKATGEDLYNAVMLNPRATSLWLLENGIKGIRYLDGSSRSGGEGSHNYVIFDDNDIDITQTFYSEAFRDAEFSEFIAGYPEIVKEAARFDSGAEMAEHYADYLAMPDEAYKKARALGYFDALARAAKAGDAGQATNVIGGVSAKKAAVALAAYGVEVGYALEAAALARGDNWQGAVTLLEKRGVPRIDAEVYADTARAFGKPEMLWLKRQVKAAGDVAADTGVLPETQEQPSDEDEGKQFKGLREGVRDYGGDAMREASGTMNNILETGESGVVTHEKYGDITVDAGEAAKKSFGLKHIITERNAEGKSVDEISALLVLLHETLREGKKIRDIHFKSNPLHLGRMEIEFHGIVAIVSKQRKQGDSEQWLLTGFDDTKKSKEATEAIQTVIARYSRSPEFSGFRNQVGAVVSSLPTESRTSSEKSSGNEQKKAGGAKIKLGKENAAVLKYFNTLVDGAKEIYPDGILEGDIERERAEIAGEPRTADAFVEMMYTDRGIDDLIRGAYAVQGEGRQRGESDEETRRNEATFDRVRTVFNPEGNGNWKAAFADIAAGREVNPHTKKIIQGMIRNRPLQYMEAWAMMKGDDSWLPGENDVKRIKRLDTEGLADEEYLEKQSPEELERIGRRLSSDRVKKKIDDKTLKLDDPDMNDYDEWLKAEKARYNALIADNEERLKEYRDWIALAERHARKERMLLEQMAPDTSAEGLKASRAQAKEAGKARQQLNDALDRMERFMRRDLSNTQRVAFLKLREQMKERERLNAELKAIAQIREIKIRDLRQILRKADVKTVSVAERKWIGWVQAHFDSYEAVARFVGRGAKDIRRLYNDFATSAEYREKLKKKLPPRAFHQIERIVFKDLAGREVRAYGELDARQRKALYKNLVDYQGIFGETGIDILADDEEFSGAEWEAARAEMKERIPADVFSKLEGLITKDNNTSRRFRVEQFTIEDLQTLAGVVNKLRKEGREREAARQDAKAELREEGREKIKAAVEKHMPKLAIGRRMAGIAATRLEEERLSGKVGVWHALHNARRFFRMLEGGVDGFLHNYITQREYDAFDEEHRHVFERQEKVDAALKEAGIKLKDLGRHTFALWNGQKATLDEMLFFYYAQYNERALMAVTFGNFAGQEERDALRGMADARDIAGGLELENIIARRYWGDMKKLEDFFSQGENAKYRKVMDIIGRDFDDNYPRLKEFAAREYNEELGSEPYYMPLLRLGGAAAEEKLDFERAMADAGHAPYIGKGMLKGRVDIPSYGQQPVQAGLYAVWDRAVVKQEHLMAYDRLHRDLKYIFLETGSEGLRDALVKGHSESGLNFVKTFISELAAPAAQEDFAALDTVNRIIRGHYAAAVLGGRIASIVKQAIESPPPFFQYVTLREYAAAGVQCMNKETLDMIRQKSVYMKARYFDPAMAVVHEMEKLYLAGKLGQAEAVLSKFESASMWGQGFIDSVCVMPGWLAAYNRKTAELNRDSPGMAADAAEAAAVRYADIVVRDCQPSSVLMDQTQLLKGSKHPFVRMFMQFQTPIASIFQQLFMDAPARFKEHGAAKGMMHFMWTWGIYALTAIVVGAMQDDDDDNDTPAEWLKKRGIDALVMPLSMIPIAGGQAAYMARSYLRYGKIRAPGQGYFPVINQGVRMANAISDRQWGKAAEAAVKGFMYYTGLPVAGMEDIQKAVETGRPQRVIGIR